MLLLVSLKLTSVSVSTNAAINEALTLFSVKRFKLTKISIRYFLRPFNVHALFV